MSDGQNTDYVDLEYCPRCNASLTFQKGFNNELPYWICKGCGEMLIRPDIEGDIIWLCDRCEAVLNIQEGFSADCGEWRCTDCGYVSKIDESQVFGSEEEYRSTSQDQYWGMSDEDVLALSDYRVVRAVNEKEDVFLVENPEDGTLRMKKILNTFDLSVYQYLFDNPIPHMPRLYGLYEGANRLVVIEEYIQGRTLADILSEGRLEVGRAADIAIQLCRILQSLHNLENPIVHRDIKPSNIIIDKEGVVWLIDINVAKWYRPDEVEDTRLLGTLYYAAPEQSGYGSTASSARSDIYSVGILLNVMITGKLPKEKKAEGEIGRVIEKCIEWEPEDRYTAGELAEVLEKIL